MHKENPGTNKNSVSLKPLSALLVWEDQGERKEKSLGDSEVTIGREPKNSIPVDDKEASRFHCSIKPDDDSYVIQDLKSTNGTFVNGVKISDSQTLKNGDILKIGISEFTFEVQIPAVAESLTMRAIARVVWDEGGETKMQTIQSEGMTIGRSSDNDLPLIDLDVSRVHCKIVPHKNGFVIVDLDSTNGTFVNDKRVSDKSLLQNGDKLHVGKHEFHFEILSLEDATMVSDQPLETIEYSLLEVPIEKKSILADLVTATVVDIKDVVKEYESPAGAVRVLNSVSLQVAAGSFVGIRGPSGSGKSTLLNMITGIDRPTSGEVIIAGQSLGDLSEDKMAQWRGVHIGVIFQFFQLLPTLTVIENVMLPMEFCRKWNPKERPQRALELLDKVGLADQAYKLPGALSGGQQQRAAIARALANEPPLILGDEPTGNLDSKTADMVFALFGELVALGTTFLMVTHDVELAKRIPRVVEVRDGELHEDGSY